MTYLLAFFIATGIVIASDTRANYFEDWRENGRIIGKKITAYWDGNQKVFLLTKPRSPIGIACQGLLFWGDERKLLATVIADFEITLTLTDNVKSVASKLNNYFRQTKRKGSNEFEVMHFLVAGIQEGKPQVFYVNTFGQGSMEQAAPIPVKWGLINGDGKATPIEDGQNITLDQGIDYVKNIILQEHKKRPPDVGNILDILVIPIKGKPYWHTRSPHPVAFSTYSELKQAISDRKLPVTILSEPYLLRYNKE